MKVAIVGRLEDYEEDYPFNKRYTIDYPFREMFDVLNILIIPVLSRLNIEEIESMCDALILPGSAIGVDPKHYNDVPFPGKEYKYDEYKLDKEVIDLFVKAKKPILGICGGMQTLNVYFGGDLNQNVVVQYILSILEILSKNFSSESVFSYLKLGFHNLDKDEIFKLENYCTKWGIKHSKWKSDFKYELEDNKEKVERLNEIRKEIINPLINLKEEIEKNKTAKDITKVLLCLPFHVGMRQKFHPRSKHHNCVKAKEALRDRRYSNVLPNLFAYCPYSHNVHNAL